MRTGRPRTSIGTHGAINTRREGGRVVAETRVRDLDGRLRQVRASGPTAAAARARLLERIRERPSLPSAGVLRPTSSFADLADLWLADLDLRDLAGNTKENYRTCLRLHVRPAFEHYTLAEVTTGRVEWFQAKQANVSSSQAKQTRTLLNMLFGYALRHDALARNVKRILDLSELLAGEVLTAVNKQRRVLGLAELTTIDPETDLGAGAKADSAAKSFNKAAAVRDVEAVSNYLSDRPALDEAASKLTTALAELETDPDTRTVASD